jgi:hypothetical protein
MTQSIPLFAADGTPWGFRTPDVAQRLIANGRQVVTECLVTS